jgi:uncharacterized membrane protein HdeD (DUF308 family)
MPLSDHEKRMLQEMEAALLTEDPRLFSALSGEARPPRRTRTLIGAALILSGTATLFAGLVAKTTPVGVLGFLIALTGVIAIVSSVGTRSSGIKGARKKTGLGSRLEERWDERNKQ